MSREPISAAAGEFGQRIRARRTQLGKSQEQLARDSSLHWSYVGQVERGQRNLTLHNILSSPRYLVWILASSSTASALPEAELTLRMIRGEHSQRGASSGAGCWPMELGPPALLAGS